MGAGLASQLLLQAVLFAGVPLFGPAVLLDWTALLTWLSGPFVGGVVCGLVRQGKAWICGLIAGALGTAAFVSAVLLRSDWWLIGAAILGGSLFAALGALIARALADMRARRPVS